MKDDTLNKENIIKSKWRKNYYFVGTLLVILTTSVCYFGFNDKFARLAEEFLAWNLLLKAFRHSKFIHLK
jgi:hypothetical protein